jgi:phosphoribosylaminoimidazole-succinocarboxamide synthase
VLPEPIPDKGRVLTAISAFWFGVTTDIIPNHMVSTDTAAFPDVGVSDLAGRSMVVRRAEMLKIECIVRGYLSGSAWKEYKASGTMHGLPLPKGMQESDQLPEPVFTPSTKADTGHDENITVDQAADIVGADVVKQAAEASLALYRRGAEMAAEKGIIIADTKFELGWIDGELALCDEVLTPDSSRFWDVKTYRPGATPPSFDKQPVRDWAEATGWDKKPPAPSLPAEVIDASRTRYVEAYERLTGRSFSDWPGVTA